MVQDTKFTDIDPDIEGESDKDYEECEDYTKYIEIENPLCYLLHTYSSHLTYHKADGTVDRTKGSKPIPLINITKTPRLKTRYYGEIADPPNAKTVMMNDCVILAFYSTSTAGTLWNGRIQVLCRRVHHGKINMWLEYNGSSNPNWRYLESQSDALEKVLFTRRNFMLKRAHPGYTRYRERLYMSLNGCVTTIIGEASLRQKNGTLLRSTKIHVINCCHQKEHDLEGPI